MLKIILCFLSIFLFSADADLERGDSVYEGLQKIIKNELSNAYVYLSLPEDSEAQPFVKEGQSLQRFDKLCDLSMLKISMAILAPCSGVVKKILVKHKDFVPWGAPLMILEASQS